jgi:hypothetical protein
MKKIKTKSKTKVYYVLLEETEPESDEIEIKAKNIKEARKKAQKEADARFMEVVECYLKKNTD